MSAHTAEIAGVSAEQELEVCRACQAAVCFKHKNGHLIRPLPVGSHTFSDRMMLGDVASCRDKLTDPVAFHHFLQLLGLGPLADAWGREVITLGKNPTEETIVFAHEQLVFHSKVAELTTSATAIDDTEAKGARSEAQMIAKLTDHQLFPWVTGVDQAPPKQPKYGAVVHIDEKHPVGNLLYGVKKIGSSGLVHVDAKSSFLHVFSYYKEHTRSKKPLARVGLVQDGFWAINTNAGLAVEQFYTQIVSLILITLGYFNQQGHWDVVFQHLSPVMVDAFKSQEDLVKQYRDFFYQR